MISRTKQVVISSYSHPRLLAVRPGQRVSLLRRAALAGVVEALHRLVLPHHQAVHHPEHDGLRGGGEKTGVTEAAEIND